MYIATIDTWYRIVALGNTADEAIDAACREYRRALKRGTLVPVRFEGRAIVRNTDITGYFGVKVYGPMLPGEGVTE